MAKKQINYTGKDFESIRQDLINYVKNFYPEQWQDFNVSSPGMAVLELNAYVGDQLSYSLDKRFNELFLDGSLDRKSVYRLAKTLGYSVPGVRPALTIVDITIEVPPTADGPDSNYLPVYRPGVRIRGAGQTFETTGQIDFSSDFSDEGVPNRIIEPIFNANEDIIRYRIIKREKAKAGTTRILKVEITQEDAIPFYTYTIADNNTLEILDVIIKPQIGITSEPTYEEFQDDDIKYYEVDALPEDKIFVVDELEPTVNGVKVGKYKTVTKRFVKEFMSDGTCKLTFGGGSPDTDAYELYLTRLTTQTGSTINLGTLLDNTALGEKVPGNSTMYVKYRTGGGILSNVGSNVLQEVSNINAVILGPDRAKNDAVINSTRANNPIPAVGGAGLPSIEEIKAYISSNFAAQKRCVTLSDYISRCYQMPGKFGTPFRIYGKVEDNKVKLYVITIDGTGKLVAGSTSTIKNNLVEYLVPFRMINDYVEINDGKVVDLELEADLLVDKTYNSNEVKVNAIKTIKEFFNVEKWQMNDNIYISQITDILREVPGVINVVDLRFYNLTSGGYSDTLIAQANGPRFLIPSTGGFRTRIIPTDNAIFGTPISMFQIRYPDKDIKVRVA